MINTQKVSAATQVSSETAAPWVASSRVSVEIDLPATTLVVDLQRALKQLGGAVRMGSMGNRPGPAARTLYNKHLASERMALTLERVLENHVIDAERAEAIRESIIAYRTAADLERRELA